MRVSIAPGKVLDKVNFVLGSFSHEIIGVLIQWEIMGVLILMGDHRCVHFNVKS